MPFPLAALGGAIVSAIAGASATTLIVGGVAATAAGVFTAAAISNHNDMKRAEAEAAAERQASREREEQELKKKARSDKKKKALLEQYGETEIPKEKMDEFWGERAEILGALQGNSNGLRKQGVTVSPEAEAALDELRAEFDQANVKE